MAQNEEVYRTGFELAKHLCLLGLLSSHFVNALGIRLVLKNVLAKSIKYHFEERSQIPQVRIQAEDTGIKASVVRCSSFERFD